MTAPYKPGYQNTIIIYKKGLLKGAFLCNINN